MKNQNIVFIAIAFALAFALAPVTRAQPIPQGGPTLDASASHQPSLGPEDVAPPSVTIHSTGNVARGTTGSFVLEKGFWPFPTYVNFSVSGTSVAGVDYVALISPTYIGQSGYGAILLKTLPDPRASSNAQAYSVVVTLEPGAGYRVGEPSSATIWIKP